MSNPQPGQSFGNYTIISELQSSGPLLTYTAYSPALSRDVTLALLSPALAQDADVRARFEQTTHALLALKHPHVLAVHDAGEVDGVPFVALQSVEARTLAARLETGPLSLAEITRIVSQLADALKYLSSNGVTPAALGLDNVLLDEHGDVHLADLGLTRLPGGPGSAADPRAAQLALGSLLAALVAGHAGADSGLNEALQRLNDSLSPERKAAVASAYEAVIRRATAANPAERYASLDDLLAAWQQAGAQGAAPPTDESIQTPPSTGVPAPAMGATPPPVVQRAPDLSGAATRAEVAAEYSQVLRRLLRAIQLVALKQARQEAERLERQYGISEIRRAAPLLETQGVQTAQELVGSVPADTAQRTRRLVTLVVALVGLFVCGVPALCFVCIALLPSSSETPTPALESTLAPVAVATRPPAVRPTPDAAATAAPPIHATLVFSDEFTTGDCNLLEGENERRAFKCEGGEYTMLSKVDGSRWSYYDDEYQDTVVEVDAHAVSGPSFIEYGLVFRVASDGDSLYGFTLTREGKFTVFRYQDNSFTDLLPYVTSSAVQKDTATNHLKVVMQQDRISVYANDVFLGSATDSNLKQGAVGLFINSDSPNAKAAFSHLRISTINP